MKNINRTASLILSFVMLLGALFVAPVSVNAADYVKDAVKKRYIYGGLDVTVDKFYKIPELTFSSKDAKNTNAEIFNKYKPIFDNAEKNIEKDPAGFNTTDLYYFQYVNGNVLSLLVAYKPPYEAETEYSVYNFNISTGKRLYNSDVAKVFSYDYADVKAAIVNDIEIMLFNLSRSSVSNSSGRSRYLELYAKNTSEENLKSVNLYIGERNELVALYNFYSKDVKKSENRLLQLTKASVTAQKNISELKLAVSETAVFMAQNRSGNPLFFVYDNSVADISKNGKITAKKTGETNVIASFPDNSIAKCKIVVKPAPKSISVSAKSVTLGAGEKFTVSESINAGAYITPSNLCWNTSNLNVASVSRLDATRACITAKKAGTANINVSTFNGKKATCKVTVKPAPTSVKLSKTAITLGVGQKFTLTESLNSGAYSSPAGIKWSSSNSAVATAVKAKTNTATITAKKAGATNVTVKLYNGKKATCKVTVKPAPKSVKLNKTSITLKKNQKYTLSATLNSGAASSFAWSTGNSKIAAVTASGGKATVTAKAKGTAYITVKTHNGKTAKCKITVK